MAGDLFESTAFAELVKTGLAVTTRERTIVDKFVTLDGIKFEVTDAWETLEATTSGDVRITWDRDRINVLKKYGILESEGSSWGGARLGANGKAFMDMLEEAM